MPSALPLPTMRKEFSAPRPCAILRPSSRAFRARISTAERKVVSDSILQRIAAGEASAVQECIDQYGNLVWSLARRFTSATGDAEDAVQEVFLDLWKSAARFDPAKASESTFVAMVARRRLIDLLRRTKSRPELVTMPEDFDSSSDHHEVMETQAEAQSAAKALELLKPEQRRVLILSIYHGMSHGEIVEATGMPLGTVKSHIRRGLTEVRNRLREDVSGEGTAP